MLLAVLVVALAASHVLAARRYPWPVVARQAAIGPMTPTFQQRLLGPVVLRAVDPEPVPLRPAV
jgi:hypothetical protein